MSVIKKPFAHCLVVAVLLLGGSAAAQQKVGEVAITTGPAGQFVSQVSGTGTFDYIVMSNGG